LRSAIVARKTFRGQLRFEGVWVSSDFATSTRERWERRRWGAVRRQRRTVAVLLLGPATILGGLVWAMAQPYRFDFLEPEGKGIYDYLVQPPLLVVLVGIVFGAVIAPGLAEVLELGDDGPKT
jgi:hypothetical protein